MPLIRLFLISLCLAFTAGAGAEQIQGVPFFRQETHQCGQAALASVMGYHKKPVDMKRLFQETYNDSLKGSLLADLENYAKGLGFKTEAGRGTLQTIKDSILAEKPVIVLIDQGVWLAAKPHYIVVVGYDEKGFIAHDGSQPWVLFRYRKFEKNWEKMGKPFLIIHP